MKILVINWQDIMNPFGGGAEVHFHEIFKRIAAWGHEVTLLCCRVDGRPDDEVIDGIRIIRRGSRSAFNFIVRKTYKLLRKEGFDIIIDDVNKIPFYTPFYVKEPLLGISHHFFGTSIFREAGLVAGLYVYISEWLMDFVYKKTPFAVVSESTRAEFIERGYNPKLFSIVPNALTQEEFPMNVSEKSEIPTISYFGRLKKYKSVDHLLNAFAEVKKKKSDARLWILGKGDFMPRLKEIAAELKIDNDTTFFGFVSEQDKQRLLSQSWCMVNTSMKEGWGITNIEANACGTPVISSNVPGLRDSVKPGVSGLLYEYGNIGQLSGILLDIINDNEKRENLSKGAVEFASSFSWDESARMMLEVCEMTIKDFNK